MKKRILIATSLLVILIIGSISVYATSFESNIDIMEKVGQLFKSHKEKSDNSIFAKGKSGGIITKDDIEQATEFYILAGYTESTAREKAIKYMLERDATYQKAISEGYSVTDEEVWAYLDELKEIINGATNKDEAQALINQFDSEEEYWQHEFEVYKINLPIEKYLNSVKQDYLNNAATIYSESEHETEHLNSCNEYLQNLQSDLAEKEDYEIIDCKGLEIFTNVEKVKLTTYCDTYVSEYGNIKNIKVLAKMTKIKNLEISGVNNSNYDFTKLNNLEMLCIKSTKLKKLNLSKNVKLKNLKLAYNPLLKKINLTKNKNLEKINLYGSGVKKITLGKNNKIKNANLNCTFISNYEKCNFNPKTLKTLKICNTQIKKVNLKKYKNLKKLSVTKEVKVIGYKGKKTIYDETL